MTDITPAQFRADFPEFANTTVFPDGQITFWLKWAYIMVRADRWMEALDLGIELFVAHNLVLEALAQKAAAGGGGAGIPGAQGGVVTSKQVDKVSVSYDANAGLILDGGDWNLTTYGTRFLRMARMMGAGGEQVSGACGPFPYVPWSPGWNA